jgi:translation initiation factor 1 (eIF-1/SUI1)
MKKVCPYTFEFDVNSKITRIGSVNLKRAEVEKAISELKKNVECGCMPTYSYHFIANYTKLIIEIE